MFDLLFFLIITKLIFFPIESFPLLALKYSGIIITVLVFVKV